MNKDQKLSNEELNNVAGGRKRGAMSSDSKRDLAVIAGKCSCHPNGAYAGKHDFVPTGNVERHFGIFKTYEFKCKYCGGTDTNWELALGILGGRY